MRDHVMSLHSLRKLFLIVPLYGLAAHFYESVAVLGHEAPEHRSRLCVAHHPMLAFNHAKRRSVYLLSDVLARRHPRNPPSVDEKSSSHNLLARGRLGHTPPLVTAMRVDAVQG